jgi:hypothetical protein
MNGVKKGLILPPEIIIEDLIKNFVEKYNIKIEKGYSRIDSILFNARRECKIPIDEIIELLDTIKSLGYSCVPHSIGKFYGIYEWEMNIENIESSYLSNFGLCFDLFAGNKYHHTEKIKFLIFSANNVPNKLLFCQLIKKLLDPENNNLFRKYYFRLNKNAYCRINPFNYILCHDDNGGHYFGYIQNNLQYYCVNEDIMDKCINKKVYMNDTHILIYNIYVYILFPNGL